MRRSSGVKAASILYEVILYDFVGIDVTKAKHDCCILDEEGNMISVFTLSNDKQGFKNLVAAISKFLSQSDLSNPRIGLESTGHYSINIQNYLLQKRLCVKNINPLQVNLLRKAQSLRKTKTANLIASFWFLC